MTLYLLGVLTGAVIVIAWAMLAAPSHKGGCGCVRCAQARQTQTTARPVPDSAPAHPSPGSDRRAVPRTEPNALAIE